MNRLCTREAPRPKEIRRQSLALINRARRGMDLPLLGNLPCGVPGEPDDCPLKRALLPLDASLEVYGGRVICRTAVSAKYLGRVWGRRAQRCRDVGNLGKWEVPIPEVMGSFVVGFDNKRRGFRDLVDHDAAYTTELAKFG